MSIIGCKSQGKSKGAPLYRANGSSTPQRGLTDREIKEFHAGIELIMSRRDQSKI